MADPTQLNQTRAAFAVARTALIQALYDDAAKSAARDSAQRRFAEGTPERVAAEAAASAASATLASAQSNERASRQAVSDAVAAWVKGVTPDDEVARAFTSTPAVLFPLRIETRFDFSVSPAVLKVRIYPDEIWINQHERALTSAEVDAAKQYYLDQLATGSDGSEQWRQIVTKMTATRAAYVLRVMTPTFGSGSSGSFTSSGTSGGGGGGIRFPDDILLRPDNWSRPAEAVLPDRWLVITTRAGVTSAPIVGKPIPEPLPTTVDPNVPAGRMTTIATDGYQIDDDIAWTVDFERAEAIGMGIRIPLNAAQSATDGTGGFDRLLVIGVKTSLSPTDSSTLVEQLMDAHHYTRGLSVVPQGTPTNNTHGSPTPFPPDDPEGAQSFEIERRNPPVDRFRAHPDLSAAADGYKLTKLLGVPSGVFRNVAGASGSEEIHASSMNRVLWPATLGYFMEEILNPVFSPTPTNTAAHDAGRTYFVNNVRARGPVPAFRVGAVPYGVLPAVSVAHWGARGTSADEATEAKMIGTLRKLLTIWKQATSNVLRIKRTTTDPLGDLTKILATYPSSREVRVRTATGGQTTFNLAQLFAFDFAAIAAALDSTTNAVLARIGHPEWSPRVKEFTYDSGASLFSGITVAPAEQLSNTSPLPQDYLAAIFNASAADLLANNVQVGTNNQTLLYKAVRHAALVEYARAARAEANLEKLSTQITTTETEFWIIRSTTTTPLTLADIFALATSGTTLGALIFSKGLVSEFRNALRGLQGLPTLELERLVTETMDLASHRLDAWLTALATRRLRELRTVQESQQLAPVGTLIGGYAWVEDLRPARRHVENRPGAGNVEIADQNGGFVHSPSMAHAATAAILRSGHLSYRAEDPAKYAIDLSSARTRAARGLLDEIRAGQSLGAVLGYRFERGLHDRASAIPKIDQYRYELRRLYPLVAKKTGEVTTDAADMIAARNVVDGLLLWSAARQNQIPFATDPQLPKSGAAFDAIQSEIARLADDVDALMDLTTAESVFQLVRGNVANATATLDALASGARPPDPEIARSVRGGIGVTHRVPFILAGDSAAPLSGGWPAPTPLAAAEPFLDAWAGKLLGDPNGVKATVKSALDSTGALTEKQVTLGDLGLRPLDLIAIARGATEANQGSILDQRLGFAAIGDDSSRSIAAVDYTRVDASSRTFPEIMELARSIGAVIAGARALGPDDFALPVETPDQQPASEADALDAASELLARADVSKADLTEVAQLLATATAALQAVVDQDIAAGATPAERVLNEGPAADALRPILRRAAGYLAGSAFPAPRATSDALLAIATAIDNQISRRLAAEAAVFVPSTGGADRLKGAVQRLQALHGRDLRVLPRFTAPAAPELQQALDGRSALLGNDDNAAQKFLQQAATVRPGLARWRQLAVYLGALGVGRPRLDVMQLPLLPGERWVGLPFGDGGPPPSGRVSLLALSPGGAALTPSDTWRGLLLDEWVEVIPNATESTAVAFHYDNPGAEAGQVILVAVPAQTGANWKLVDLVASVDETLDLAKIRGVDAEMLALGQLLPAIFFTENSQSAHTVSTTWFGNLFGTVVGSVLGGQ